jgi:hypothetical protein
MQLLQVKSSKKVLPKYYSSTYVLIATDYAKFVSSKCANPVTTKIEYMLKLQPPICTACTSISLFQVIITAVLLYN